MALVIGAGFMVAALFPLVPRAICLAVIRLWARALLAALGARLELEGELPAGPALLVATHISWLDVVAIAALRPCVFVCKADIADWPGFGWLLGRVGTIFMRRGSARFAARTVAAATRCLRAGLPVGVFPEGTSSDGEAVLPFSPALFQAALDAGVPVQPLALGYSSHAAVYANDIGFGESMLAIAGASDLRVTVSVLPTPAAATRRDAALRSHELIALRVRAGAFGHAPEGSAEGILVAVQSSRPGLV
jgi:1-acyl-sn-glycerol-3-phosphate acyltransferase